MLNIFNSRSKSTVTINGKTYEGNNISVRNGVVSIDGKPITETKAMELHIHGNVGELVSDMSVNITGKVLGNVSAKGSVNCDAVGGNVQAGGSVNCDDVGGSVTAGGSVNMG